MKKAINFHVLAPARDGRRSGGGNALKRIILDIKKNVSAGVRRFQAGLRITPGIHEVREP
mgnify:CR=1 FL=1